MKEIIRDRTRRIYVDQDVAAVLAEQSVLRGQTTGEVVRRAFVAWTNTPATPRKTAMPQWARRDYRQIEIDGPTASKLAYLKVRWGRGRYSDVIRDLLAAARAGAGRV